MIQPEIRMAEDLLDNIENQRLYQVLIGGGQAYFGNFITEEKRLFGMGNSNIFRYY